MLTSTTPSRITVRCADSAGNTQHVHIDHTRKGLVAAGRGGGQTLHFTHEQCALMVGALMSHVEWLLHSGHDRSRPLRISIDCFSPRGVAERAHVESDDERVLVLREGGMYLHFELRPAVHLVEALVVHLRWVMARWTP